MKKSNSKSKTTFLVLLGIFGFLVFSVILIKVCLSAVSGDTSKETDNGKINDTPVTTSLKKEDITVPDDVSETIEEAPEITEDDFSLVTKIENGFTKNGKKYVISKGGEYTLSGSFTEGQIVVENCDEKVTLVLNNVNISSKKDSVIKIIECDKVVIKAYEGTENYISDLRDKSSSDEDEDEVGDGAIYADSDLTINGEGQINVYGNYNNGIHSKKDVTIKNVTLNITSVNNAIKGNDSVTLESGKLVLISTGGNGIKTKNNDVSESGKQRGNITVSDGCDLTIYSACDGFDAAYNAQIDGGNIYVYTAKNSQYTGETYGGTSNEYYLIIPQKTYASSQRYSMLCTDSNGKESWCDFEYYTMVSSRNGMQRTQYYCLKASIKTVSTFSVYLFNSDDKNSKDNYVAKYDGNFNSSMNAFVISSISGSKISGDFSNLQTGSDNTVSSKGIKAENEIISNGGNVLIKSTDDSVHSNNNITFNGGTYTISSGDDGMHAEELLQINGDTQINVVTSYEGLEGNLIEINGSAKVIIYATDDGINACGGSKTPCITVNGGYVDVTTASGDTDGIDSNGNIVQNGGLIFVKGGASQGQMMGSIDVDGSITITGGTTVALGGICETPTNSSAYTVKFQRKSFQAGDYEVKDSSGNVIAQFSIDKSYQSCWISSSLFEKNTKYTVYKDGSSFTTWTQNSQTVSG